MNIHDDWQHTSQKVVNIHNDLQHVIQKIGNTHAIQTARMSS